jgi:hypothetical protein
MTKYVFDRIMSGEEIRDMIQKELGLGFRVQVKINRIEIVQDASKACLFLFHEVDGRTECTNPSGYMPFGVLRIAVILVTLTLFFIVNVLTNNTSFIIFGLEALVIILLMRSPSQGLVKRVREILEKEARKA